MNAISLSTWLYDQLPFEEAAKRVKALGFDYIELSGYNWVNDVWTVEEVAKVCEKLRLGVLSVHCNHHALYTPDDWTFDRFEQYHEKLYRDLSLLGHPIIVEHGLSASCVHVGDTQRQLALLRGLSRAHGFVLSYENVPATVFRTAQDMDGIFNDGLGFTFDIAHSAYIGLEPLSFEKHFAHLVNTHLYDVVDGVNLGDWAPVGVGKIDWAPYFAALKRANYDGPLTIELNEDRFIKVLEVYRRVVSPQVQLDVADACALYSRKQIEKYL